MFATFATACFNTSVTDIASPHSPARPWPRTHGPWAAAAAHNAQMRINLVTPFAEKDAAKALGARWDATLKVWYISDVKDLTPFQRWIPDMKAATAVSAIEPAGPAMKINVKASGGSLPPTTPMPNVQVPHCGCAVLPWDACVHTRKA